MLEPYFNNIDGFMTYLELQILFAIATRVRSIVEIGSWKGKSTHALLTGCKGDVFAVDHFKGTLGEEYAHREAKNNPEGVFPQFLENVGSFKNLKVLKMSSLEAVNKFEDLSIDMVFIDADHSYEVIKEDIKAWYPKAIKFFCGHDYHLLGVKKAVDEFSKTIAKRYNFSVYGSIWFFEFIS